ncbi:hypothetical protein LCGC14_1687530 [marine sediment metagenome]|uniref:Uncharacterized protein n=1 Tax=marine sediment metagenome TaxID=412755 RepID=A0A0F9HM73_9ZZZZ
MIKDFECLQAFLMKKFWPIGRYCYEEFQYVIVDECPICKDSKLYYGVNIVGYRSEILVHYYVSIDDIFKWIELENPLPKKTLLEKITSIYKKLVRRK